MNDVPVRDDGSYILYWMIASRRSRSNFTLDRALELSREFDRPVLVLEPLRIGYEWASDRFHAFVLEGMADNARAFEGAGVTYYPYVELEAGQGRGLLEALAAEACVVVTDDYPAFFLPRMIAAAGRALPVALEAVDSNGLLPMRATDQVFARAFDFRRFLQRELGPHLRDLPRRDPLRSVDRAPANLPKGIEKRWPRASEELLAAKVEALAELDVDHEVKPVGFRGGARAGLRAMREFIDERLGRYGEDRNHPDTDAASGLSPYLHFGHVSAHGLLHEIAAREAWSTDSLGETRGGKRIGWWGMSETVESFLDELVTWREIGFNRCALTDDFDQYESLPGWAQATLEEHADDPRPQVYTLAEFEAAQTHDELWNAAQTQLRIEGRIHNYLRMLWGKKILHWSESPREALRIMIELNNKYALDGRDPNSYSGIFWVLGRYDRAWGPERPVFGKIRYMASDNTHRKLRLRNYLEYWCEWAEGGTPETQGSLF